MKPLDSIEIKLCQLQAKIFESSFDYADYSSPMFIRRFMFSSIAKSFDNKTYLLLSNSTNDIFETLDEEYGKSSYGKYKYSKDQLYWIGYIYRCFAIIFNLSSKQVYRLINGKEIIKYYNTYHTFDIVEAAKEIAENINYDYTNDINDLALKYMRKLFIQDKLKDMLGKQVEVIVDRPLGSKHPEYIDTTYNLNYGYIKDIKAADQEYQDAYILGVNEPLLKYNGKVIAIIDRKNDFEDKLIVSDKNNEYTNSEIRELIKDNEKYFKYRIIRNKKE